jgi:thiol:disulfide interchange protein DsbC
MTRKLSSIDAARCLLAGVFTAIALSACAKENDSAKPADTAKVNAEPSGALKSASPAAEAPAATSAAVQNSVAESASMPATSAESANSEAAAAKPQIIAAEPAASTPTATDSKPTPSVAPARQDAKPVAADKASTIEQIKMAVEQWQQGRIKVDEVRETPIPGIYEVRSGSELIYVHESARYVFLEGQLIDMQSSESLTQKRMDEILMVNFDDLPLEYAIKQVNGKGTRKIAVFEDPNCGHCRNMRRELNVIDDLTIYTFTLPILAKDSESKARKAWCAPDKVKAWNALMLEGKVPENDGACANPVGDVTELAKKLSVRGTPTVFFTNGRRLPGGVPGEQLRKMIDEYSKKA